VEPSAERHVGPSYPDGSVLRTGPLGGEPVDNGSAPRPVISASTRQGLVLVLALALVVLGANAGEDSTLSEIAVQVLLTLL